jgi:uncharacterized protein involved in cysteine biosynthesis
VLGSLWKALLDLSDPGIRRVLWRAPLLAAVALGLLWGAAVLALQGTRLLEWELADSFLDFFGGLAALVLVWLLFPIVLGAIAGLFLDTVAGAVERRHYPDLEPARTPSLVEELGIGLRFSGLGIGLNLLSLPLYLVPPLIPFVFSGLNGYLLGREYFDFAAHRRLDPAAARDLWKRRRGGFIAAGVLIALLSGLPVVNLLVPVFGTAFLVHRLEAMRRKDAAESRQLDSPPRRL